MDTLVLFLILGEMLSVFHTENNVCSRLIIYGLYSVEVGSFCAHFLKSFNHKWGVCSQGSRWADGGRGSTEGPGVDMPCSAGVGLREGKQSG